MYCTNKLVLKLRHRANCICSLHDIQKPGKKGQGESGWTVQAKMDIYLWLGEYDSKTPEHSYLNQLPPGYEPEYENNDSSRPPVAVTYQGTTSDNNCSETIDNSSCGGCMLGCLITTQSYIINICIMNNTPTIIIMLSI